MVEEAPSNLAKKATQRNQSNSERNFWISTDVKQEAMIHIKYVFRNDTSQSTSAFWILSFSLRVFSHL